MSPSGQAADLRVVPWNRINATPPDVLSDELPFYDSSPISPLFLHRRLLVEACVRRAGTVPFDDEARLVFGCNIRGWLYIITERNCIGTALIADVWVGMFRFQRTASSGIGLLVRDLGDPG